MMKYYCRNHHQALHIAPREKPKKYQYLKKSDPVASSRQSNNVVLLTPEKSKVMLVAIDLGARIDWLLGDVGSGTRYQATV
jgi:hypothetical protein